MNFSLRTLLYATSLIATAVAGFGVLGLFLIATVLAIWRLAFPGEQPLRPWLEQLLAAYIIASLGVVLMIAGLLGLDGWSFDPAEYDVAPQVCKWIFATLAIAPVYWWLKEKPLRQANGKENRDVELPEDFP